MFITEALKRTISWKDRGTCTDPAHEKTLKEEPVSSLYGLGTLQADGFAGQMGSETQGI